MLSAACVLAGLAALVHVYIFVIESLQFEKPATLRTFGIRADEAAVLKPVFYNQGFYNLFLAIAVAVGVVLVAAGATSAGATAVLIGTGSMVAAGAVLLASDRSKARAALVQAAVPALAVLLTVIGLVTA